jgi:hypothetical protein
MTEQQPDPTDHDQDAEPASTPTGAAGSEEDETDQDAGPASEPPDPPSSGTSPRD